MGALLAAFFVFRTLFTDGPANPWHFEYLIAHALTIAVYAITGLFPLRFAKFAGPVMLIPLLLPAMVLVAIYSEPSVTMRVVTLAAALLGTGLGAWLGASMAGRWEGSVRGD